MTDPGIPSEAVEAVAELLYQQDCREVPLGYTKRAWALLEAAAPLLKETR